MNHFSNGVLLNYRDNLLLMFNTKTSEKVSVKVPQICSIKGIHFFTQSGLTSYIELTDSKFSILYSLKIMSGVIIDMNIKKSCFFHPNLLICSRTTKIYQVSEDHYYDMIDHKYINPDFN